MKAKHNKKRNTMFLYEILMKEATACIVSKDEMRKATVVALLKESFSKNTILRDELELYQGILETKNLPRNIAEQILRESINKYKSLDKEYIFDEQTKLINNINRRLSPNVFSNFVSNYKNMATIAQIFGETLPVKNKVILENTMIEKMCSKIEEVKEEMKPLDDLVFKTYIKKFNEKYSKSLLKEQKELLTHYIMTFSDGGTSLKFFLNEELGRIKDIIRETIKNPEFNKDEQFVEMIKKVGQKIESFKFQQFNETMLSDFLKIQQFINEADSFLKNPETQING